MLIKASYIITMGGKGVIKDGYLAFNEEGKITYVGKEKLDEGDVLNLEGRIIIPGLINAHTHVAMTVLRGLKDDVVLSEWLYNYIFPAEARLKADDVYWGTLQGIAEMIESGTTAFADMYFFEEKIADAVVESGVRANLSRGTLDINKTVEDAIKEEIDFLNYVEKLWSKDKKLRDRIVYYFGPHAPYTCSKELLTKIKELADEKKLGIHIHLAETKWELEEIKKKVGMSPVEYLDAIGILTERTLAAHVVWASDRDLDILARRGVSIAHNPTSNLKLASGIARVPNMLERGINVAIGTDGPASNNRLDMLMEMRMAALIHKGYLLNPTVVTAEDVLRMATINGAKAIGMEKIIGSLDEGKYADFVVINPKKVLQGTPIHDIFSMIIYALDLRAIEAVYVGGKKIYDNGELLTIRIDKVREKVQEIRERLEEEIKSN